MNGPVRTALLANFDQWVVNVRGCLQKESHIALRLRFPFVGTGPDCHQAEAHMTFASGAVDSQTVIITSTGADASQ